MKHGLYLFMTFLIGILSFSQTEARIIASDRAQIGAPSWSVTIPVKDNPSMAQRTAFTATVIPMNATRQPGKISENESPRPQDRVKIPKKDTNQQTKQGKTPSGEQRSIFDRWGNLKNQGSK
jgi:hypothetical protein